jgi:chromatin remodeling complex protein RSC6
MAKTRSKSKSRAKGKVKRTVAKAKLKSKVKRAVVRAKVKRTVAKAAVKSRAKRKPNPAFMKPLRPDGALAAVVGSDPLPRTEITKKLWAYIKRNGLQDKVNRRNINADDKLRPLFDGKKMVSMFEMTKYVAKHAS